MSRTLDGRFLPRDEALPVGTRMLVWKMQHNGTILEVSISEPLADGSCRSQWQTIWRGSKFRQDMLYHSSAADCDEHVRAVLDRHERLGWTLKTGPVVVIAENER